MGKCGGEAGGNGQVGGKGGQTVVHKDVPAPTTCLGTIRLILPAHVAIDSNRINEYAEQVLNEDDMRSVYGWGVRNSLHA